MRRARRLRPAAVALALSVLFVGVSWPVAAEDRKPLLLTGTRTLYERVLTRPDAALAVQPGAAPGAKLPYFSQLYVYEHKQADGVEWLLVGAGSRGKTAGWLRADAAIPWKSQMALTFTNPAGRDRTLLFRDRSTVVEMLKAPKPAEALKPLREAAESGRADPRLISIEPEKYVDPLKSFYLLPILQAEELDSSAGFRARVLEVASISKTGEGPTTAMPGAEDRDATALRTFSAAIVFVADSTLSMGPYLDRTRLAVQRICEASEKAGLANRVKFGLVAFRSSTAAVPALEYTAKVFADPNEVKSGADFLKRVAALKAAEVSSASFDEDPYAGIMAAVKEIDWRDFGGRYLVMISDAGAIRGRDKLSTTGLDADEVRLELERLGLALYALHLKTPEGKRDHASAERQYKGLAHNATVSKSLYYPVEAGSVERFGSMVDTLAQEIVDQVRRASKGEMAAGNVRSAKDGTSPAAKPAAASLEAQIQDDSRLLGLAMQLAYLGRKEGTQAPKLFHAWLADRDLVSLDRATTEVRLLLTKNQLSDLAQVVETILRAGDESQDTSTANFFDLIRSAAAHVARDPGALNDSKATKLGELGLLGEYLDGLPYKSDVMGLSRDVWTSWSVTEQEQLLDTLRRKLRLYRVFNEDADRWIRLASDADEGDAVYPVPLTALP